MKKNINKTRKISKMRKIKKKGMIEKNNRENNKSEELRGVEKIKIDDIESNYIKLKDELLYQNNEIKNVNKINKYIIWYLIFNISIVILITIYKQTK